MASEDNEVVTDQYPAFRLYKNGRVERFYEHFNEFYVPPSLEDPATGVSSKDITISSHVSARLYLPKNTPNEKLPVLVFYHGGGLVIGSAFFNRVHHFLNHLVSESNAICVSVEYRLAPEIDLSTLYEDCWIGLQWVASHHSENDNSSNNTSKDSWLTNYGDFNRVFIGGESAGGNIAYHMAMRAGKESLNGDVKILGSILACPFFLMTDKSNLDNPAYHLWIAICPELESGLSAIDSPMINPLAEKAPSLSGLGCSRLFMGIAEKDVLIPREIMVRFVEGVKESGWNGELEFFEVEGEEHCFFVANPETEKAKDMIKRFASFIKHK